MSGPDAMALRVTMKSPECCRPVVGPFLTDEQWEALLLSARSRRKLPAPGSTCDAFPDGCGTTADRLLVGPPVVLCAAHLRQLEDRADALGLRIYPFARLAAVVYADADSLSAPVPP